MALKLFFLSVLILTAAASLHLCRQIYTVNESLHHNWMKVERLQLLFPYFSPSLNVRGAEAPGGEEVCGPPPGPVGPEPLPYLIIIIVLLFLKIKQSPCSFSHLRPSG